VGDFYYDVILIIFPNHTYQDEDDSYDEEYVDKSSDRIGGYESEYPEDEEDDGYCFEHEKKSEKYIFRGTILRRLLVFLRK
jgi:hypothetical protein